MRLLDAMAFVAATRHARAPLVTASLREVSLDTPARVGDLVAVAADVVSTGHRSLVVRADLAVEGAGSIAATGELVMVVV